MRKFPSQYSFFGLLFAVTLAALITAGVLSYRKSFTAQLRWINVSSPLAVQLFPQANIVQHSSGEYGLEYYAMRRDIQKLIGVLNGASFRVGEQSVKATGLTKQAAEAALASLRAHDVLPNGNYVIRGKVIDSAGQPLSNATIDMFGDFMFVNCFQTRQDGTFVAALNDKDPNFRGAGSYSIRIRTTDESKRCESMSFRLKATEPERVIIITVR